MCVCVCVRVRVRLLFEGGRKGGLPSCKPRTFREFGCLPQVPFGVQVEAAFRSFLKSTLVVTPSRNLPDDRNPYRRISSLIGTFCLLLTMGF